MVTVRFQFRCSVNKNINNNFKAKTHEYVLTIKGAVYYILFTKQNFKIF